MKLSKAVERTVNRRPETSCRVLLGVGVASTITIPLAILLSVPRDRGSFAMGGTAAVPFVAVLLVFFALIDGLFLASMYYWANRRPKAVLLLSAYIISTRLWLGLQLVPTPDYDFRRFGSIIALGWAGASVLVAVPAILDGFRAPANPEPGI